MPTPKGSDSGDPGSPGRGLISSILHQARACLKEPSIPQTPLTSVQERSLLFTPPSVARPPPPPATSSPYFPQGPSPPVPNQQDPSRTPNCRYQQQPSPQGQQQEGWHDDLSGTLKVAEEALFGEDYEGLAKALEHLHELVEPLIKTLGADRPGERYNLERIKEAACSLLIRVLLVPSDTTSSCSDGGGEDTVVLARMRAVRSLLKTLKLDLSRFCLLADLNKSHQPDFSVLAQLNQACLCVSSLTASKDHDDLLVSTDVIGSILSFLGSDAEPLLSVARRYAAQGSKCQPAASYEGSEGAVRSLVLPLAHAVNALKNLSASEAQQERLNRLGALHIAASLIDSARKVVLAQLDVGAHAPDPHLIQFLVQITAALRNLCVNKSQHREVTAIRLPQILCSLIRPLAPYDRELMLNVVRVLGKLSLHEATRVAINESPDNIRDILYLLEVNTTWGSHVYGELMQPHTMAIVVRVAFILGNLTATNNRNRRLVGLRYKGVDVMVELLEVVGSIWLAMMEDQTSGEDDGNDREDDDGGRETERQLEEVLVKLIRLLGNVSIDAEVGKLVAGTEGIETLVSVLRFVVGDMRPEREELLLNTVSALTNLSFYLTVGDQLFALRGEMSLYLYDVLLQAEDEEAITETARAFGNLSRDKQVRQVMAASKVDTALVYLLDHPAREVVLVVVGALVNITADPSNQEALLLDEDLDLGSKLVKLLRRSGLKDLDLSCVVCKALYNFLMGKDDARGVLGDRNYDMLSRTLAELTETAKEIEAETRSGQPAGKPGSSSGHSRPHASSVYSLFLSVAEALQHRLKGSPAASNTAIPPSLIVPPPPTFHDVNKSNMARFQQETENQPSPSPATDDD